MISSLDIGFLDPEHWVMQAADLEGDLDCMRAQLCSQLEAVFLILSTKESNPHFNSSWKGLRSNKLE